MHIVNHDNTYDKPYETSNELLDAALAYARGGKPVFPLRPGTKEPPEGFRGGFHNATTDPEQIREWWKKTPNANIGIPTGTVSGFVVLDVDRDEGGPESLKRLEAEHGKLPETYTVETGGGGHHLWFETPADREIPTNAGVLGWGLDLRGKDTGYVVAPPSVTVGEYETVKKLPLAEMPSWLLDKITCPNRGAGSSSGLDQVESASAPISIDVAGEEIREGTRNGTLTRIAGRLHDGTRSLSQLARDLRAINAARCSTPLPEDEVGRIAKSIFWREPCRPSSQAPEHVLEMLDSFETSAIWGGEWKGMAGSSDRSTTVALLRFACRYGKPYIAPGEDHPTGVEVSVDMKSLALETATSERGAFRSVRRMRLDPERQIFRTSTGRDGVAGKLVLDCRAKCQGSTHSFSSREAEEEDLPTGWTYDTLRAPFTASRLRWTAPEFDRGVRVGTIYRLGKGVEKIVDPLEAAGGVLEDHELADAMNLSRVRDLRRDDGPLDRAVAAGVVVDDGKYIWLTEDWLEALNRERERAGEIEKYRLDQAKYERERRGRRTSDERPVDPAPTTEEMKEMSDSRADRRKECIERALVALFDAKPDYRVRRVGQITCALVPYLPEPFPRGVGLGGVPKDGEVREILEANGVAA